MTTLLAKLLHPAPTATSHDPDREPGTPGPRNGGKPRRRRLLAALMMPPVISMLALLGAGTASANDAALISNQVVFSIGGLNYTGGWWADISCNAQQHAVTFDAGISPAWDNEHVMIHFWLYSWQTRQWYSGLYYDTSNATQRSGYTVNYTLSEPRGSYTVDVEYSWAVQGRWSTTPVQIPIYQQYGTTVGSNGIPQNSCQA